MAVYLDDNLLDIGDDHPTVRKVIDVVRPQLDGAGRMVVLLRCNGAVVEEHDLDSTLARQVADIERLDLVTAAKSQLAHGALEAALQMLTETRAVQATVIDMLAADDTDAALSTLAGCLSDWGQAHAATVQTLNLAHIDVADMTVAGRPAPAVLQEVVDHLTQLRSCLQERDYVSLGDTLQYEILPFFDDWESLLKALLERTAAALPS